jgi:hypothetical protein
VVQDYQSVNLYAGGGVAVRELVTDAGPADYVLFVNRQAVGVIEAKKQGTTLSGVEWQTVKYQRNMPGELPAYLIGGRLPFGYESTGSETWFTCGLDPSRRRGGCSGSTGPRRSRGQDKTTVDGLRSFLAVLGSQDVGLFISAGGFTSDAEREVRSQENRRITLIDMEKLFDLWVQHYTDIDDAEKVLLPLRPVHFLAPGD